MLGVSAERSERKRNLGKVMKMTLLYSISRVVGLVAGRIYLVQAGGLAFSTYE